MDQGEHVILLHGLSDTSVRMRLYDIACRSVGYSTTNLSYPSTLHRVEELVENYLAPVVQGLTNRPKLHFVTHSLGGILLRYYMQNTKIPNIGRSVLLAPPNKGSEIMELYNKFPLFIAMNGPAAPQCGIDEHCFPATLSKPMQGDLGILAGSLCFDPFASMVMPHPNDGRVSVLSTKLAEMKDHLVLPVTHGGITFNPRAIFQTMHFLNEGAFYR